MNIRKWIIAAVAAIAPAFGASAADNYPTRAITVVVGFPPGGTTDLVARLLAAELKDRLGQSIVVENKPGGTGSIAAIYIAAAPADGYRLLMTAAGPHGTMPAVSSKMRYDAIADFTPVAAVSGGPNVLMVNPEIKARNLQELLAIARQHPGTLNFGSTSPGSSTHMSGELIKKMAKVDIVNIAYQGGGPMLMALVGGQIQIAIDNLPSALPQIRSGKVRAIAITTLERFPGAPDIPTMAESGLPGYEVSSWYGVLGPANLPAPIVALLNKEINAVLIQDTFKARMMELGAVPIGGPPSRFAGIIAGDIDKWKKVVAENGLQLLN